MHWTIINVFLIAAISYYTYRASAAPPVQENFSPQMDAPPSAATAAVLNETAVDFVKQSNYFDEDAEIANFGSNVIDMRHFYSIQYHDNTNVPETELRQSVKTTPLRQDPLHQWSSSANFDTFKPDTWQYRDELVMNGGPVYGAVRGYSNTAGIHAPQCAPHEKSKPTGYIGTGTSTKPTCRAALDDIRMGKGAYYKQNP